MYGDFFLELMRHVHRGFDLFVAVGLEAGHVVIRSRGRVHLDHIRARGKLLPDGSQNLRHTVRHSSHRWRGARLKRSERGVQAIAAHKHPRAGHLAPIDQVAHGDVHVLVRPQIPHGRHTRFKRAHRSLEAGVTTERDLGADQYMDIAMRDLINRGEMAGPRMFVCGYGLYTTFTPFKPGAAPPVGGVADGVPEVLRAVRQQLAAGADVIKMYAASR